MLEFNIGNSALQAAQRAMEVTGNNVANANSPGYHRQLVKLAAQSPMILNGQSFGRGVEVVDIHRAVSLQLESAITAQKTQSGYIDALQASLSQLQAMIPVNESSIANQLGTVFNSLQQASSQMANAASRKIVVAEASNLALQFNSLANGMDQLRTSLDDEVRVTVNRLNPMLKQIAEFNLQIASFVNQGLNPNDLLDKRDQLINEVATQIPLEIQQGAEQQVTLLQSGAPLVIGGRFQQLQMGINTQGAMEVSIVKGNSPLDLSGGELGGRLQMRNVLLVDYRARLDDLARQVARAFDAIQSTGIGPGGGFQRLSSQRPVLRVDTPLSESGLSFAPQAGSLFISLTNTATGARTLREVAIDPSSQSLLDVASTIGAAVPELQAFVSVQGGTMTLIAAPGYRLDFAGGVDESPTTSFGGGSTVSATTSGLPAHSENTQYTYRLLNSGTVGVTPGLQVEVSDQTGSVLSILEVGAGYEAGRPLPEVGGVSVTLSAGTVVAGDSLSFRAIGNPDAAGLLSALGLNTFFVGHDASSLRINDVLSDNPEMLATSRSLAAGDTSNLQRFAALQDIPFMDGGTQTFTTYFHQTVSDLGARLSVIEQQSETNQVLSTRLHEQQQTLSGVDVNEEMIQVIKYQQMFQTAAKFISAVNEMYQMLFQSL